MVLLSMGSTGRNLTNPFVDILKGGFMNNERREFVRYQIKPNTIFLYSNYSPVKGWVKDICKEGMAFEYMPNDVCEPKPEIRLILTVEVVPFYLSDLFCKTIYDVEVDKNDESTKKRYGLRRCGVQFRNS